MEISANKTKLMTNNEMIFKLTSLPSANVEKLDTLQISNNLKQYLVSNDRSKPEVLSRNAMTTMLF
jgi:hypothetical protein